MHFEVLIEDESGKRTLDILMPKILGHEDTFRVIPYKGLGRVPRGMRDARNARSRILLENLPKLLKGYGRTHAGYSREYRAAVVVVCDLDDKCLKVFRNQLIDILRSCTPPPETRFCVAIEEGEAWLLGDVVAVKNAYPGARAAVLDSYVNDSVCGTWETLANAVHPGGAETLSALGWQAVGAEKSRWAEAISPHMDVANNRSPSFQYFRKKIQELTGPDKR